MKACVVALFLALDVTQALWLNADEAPEMIQPEIHNGKVYMQPAWPAPVTPPAVKPGTGEELNSGDKFALESEVEPGKFVSIRAGNPDQMGDPKQWLEMRHITNGQFGLVPATKRDEESYFITPGMTFSMSNFDGNALKSGDFVKWTHEKKQIDLLSQGLLTGHPMIDPENKDQKAYMWPYPMVMKDMKEEEHPDFLIEHAREVDLDQMRTMKSPTNLLGPGGWGFDSKLLTDPREGEPIKDGDSIWVRHVSTDPDGPWLFMSGDVAEGDHVAFPHHYPGFDGRVKHYAIDKWMKGGNDPHATSARFTVRKLGFTPVEEPAKESAQDSGQESAKPSDPNFPLNAHKFLPKEILEKKDGESQPAQESETQASNSETEAPIRKLRVYSEGNL